MFHKESLKNSSNRSLKCLSCSHNQHRHQHAFTSKPACQFSIAKSLFICLIILVNSFSLASSQISSEATDPVSSTTEASHLKNSKQQHKAGGHAGSANEDFEKMKNDALMNAFKLKLLQLLDVDEVPSPSEVNFNDQIPEPIMKEYNRLLKNQAHSARGRQQHHSNSYSSLSNLRGLRQSQDDALDIEEDTIRFNGSVVQEMTLMPRKVTPSDKQWCKTANTTPNPHEKSKKIPDPKPNHKHQSHHQQQHHQATTIRCFTFLLDQNEFHDYHMNSAKMFLRFDENLLNDFFLPSLALKLVEQQNKPSDIANAQHGFKPYIYVEVNGHLVKKINVVKLLINEATGADNNAGPVLKAAQVDEDSTESENEETESQSSTSILEYIDLRDRIQQTLSSKKNVLNVRILLNNDLLNYTRPNELAESLFAKLEEHVALNVKFGERVSARYRAKRQLASNGPRRNQSKNNNQASQQLTNRSHRDCSELRKVGFTSSNYSCCREVLSFSMEQLGWSHWILSPKTIEYKYCRGGCFSGLLPRFDNTQIVYKMFELSQTFESTHCCNIYDYEEDIAFIYGTPPNFLTKMVSLNAKTCMCS